MKPTSYALANLFFKRLFIVFVFYQLIRIGFYFYNRSFFPDIDLQTYIGGVIFDLSAIGYINIIFGILHLIPGRFQQNKTFQKTLFILFFGVNALFITLNFVDFEYFKFIGRRSSFSMITADGMHQEIVGLLQSYIIDYWEIPLMSAAFIYLFWFCLKQIDYKENKSTFSFLGLLICVLSVSVLFVMGRGIGRKPIRIVDASMYGPVGNSALVLNTPFTVIKTAGKKETLEDVKYFNNKEANAIFNPIHSFQYNESNKKNVVLIILESFGNENIKRGQTPFFDSLIQKSLYFENGFANGKLSIDAVPSTISSIPNLMNTSYISSSYALNDVYALPHILNEAGYHTSFFHGAFNGSQNFDQYTNVAGFSEYYGKDQYIGPESFDGKWGVFDEDFLQFSVKKLNEFKSPFFSTIFTISSHPPFTIPEKYKNKFPKGTTEIHESIAYADYALAQFFKEAEKQAWFNNTLFILTADHTSSSGEEPEFKNNIGKFRIPILFYSPSDPSLQGVHTKNFQQIDILPSLIDYLQLNTKIITYGKSYRSENDFVINYLDNIYNLVKGDFYLAFDGKKSLGLFNWKTDPLLQQNLIESNSSKLNELEKYVKAYIQSYNSRVRNNALTLKR